MPRSRRAGRPRKDGPRKPSGRLRQAVDHGTPEVLARRAESVGREDAARQEAEHAIGRLYLRGVINEGQHAAGLKFARLAHRLERLLMAPRRPRAVRLDGLRGGEAPDDAEAYRRTLAGYQGAYEAVSARGRRVLMATVDAVKGEDPTDVEAVMEGLEALREHFRMTPGRRRREP